MNIPIEDEYHDLLYDWKIRLTQEAVEEAKGHWFMDNGERLVAEVKRLRKVLKNAHEFVVEEEGDLHDWHWSVINHLFDVRGEDCECSDCCEHETCPKCHACLEHYECQCEEEEE
tara:strand:- start:72 stop:416 length:345 start_codon:yes stop_codon:yes gene_type:complete